MGLVDLDTIKLGQGEDFPPTGNFLELKFTQGQINWLAQALTAINEAAENIKNSGGGDDSSGGGDDNSGGGGNNNEGDDDNGGDVTGEPFTVDEFNAVFARSGTVTWEKADNVFGPNVSDYLKDKYVFVNGTDPTRSAITNTARMNADGKIIGMYLDILGGTYNLRGAIRPMESDFYVFGNTGAVRLKAAPNLDGFYDLGANTSAINATVPTNLPISMHALPTWNNGSLRNGVWLGQASSAYTLSAGTVFYTGTRLLPSKSYSVMVMGKDGSVTENTIQVNDTGKSLTFTAEQTFEEGSFYIIIMEEYF